MAFHREVALIGGNPIFPAIVEAMFTWAADIPLDGPRSGVEDLTITTHASSRHRRQRSRRRGSGDAGHLTRANALYRRIEAPAG